MAGSKLNESIIYPTSWKTLSAFEHPEVGVCNSILLLKNIRSLLTRLERRRNIRGIVRFRMLSLMRLKSECQAFAAPADSFHNN